MSEWVVHMPWPLHFGHNLSWLVTMYSIKHRCWVECGMRKRQSNLSKFVYRHYMQMLAVCPPQMKLGNYVWINFAEKSVYLQLCNLHCRVNQEAFKFAVKWNGCSFLQFYVLWTDQFEIWQYVRAGLSLTRPHALALPCCPTCSLTDQLISRLGKILYSCHPKCSVDISFYSCICFVFLYKAAGDVC